MNLEFTFLAYQHLEGITYCLKCQNMYTLDYNNNNCLSDTNLDISCQYGKYDNNGNFICFFDNQICYQFQNCVACNEEGCYECIDGYFLDSLLRKCVPCPPMQCQPCIQQSKQLKDFWKQEIQPFYDFLMKEMKIFHHFKDYVKSQFRDDYEIICISIEIKDQFLENCYQGCSICEIIHNSARCIKCNDFENQVIRSLDYYDQCLQCPSNCAACKKRDDDEIKSMNKYFTITEENEKYIRKCYSLNSNQKNLNLYTNQDIMVECQQYDRCTKRVVFEWNLYCDYEDFLKLDRNEQTLLYSNYFIDDFFQNSKSYNIEQKELTNYFNSLYIEYIDYNINFISDKSGICDYRVRFFLQTTFMEQILWLKQINVKFTGILPQTKFKDFILIISGFSTVIIENVKFMQSLLNCHSLKSNKIKYSQLVSLIVKFDADFRLISLEFFNLNLFNFTLNNIFYLYKIMFYLPLDNGFKSIKINITNLTIIDSYFQTSKFIFLILDYNNNNINLFVKNIKIFSSSFFSSDLISSGGDKQYYVDLININNILVDDTYFFKTKIFHFPNVKLLNFQQMILQNLNFIENSYLILSNQFTCLDIQINNQIIVNSYIFSNVVDQQFQQNLQETIFISFNKIQFNDITYENFKCILHLIQYENYFLDLNIENLKLTELKFAGQQKSFQINDIIDDYTIINLNCQICTLKNIEIIRENGAPEISILNSQKILLQNLRFSQQLENDIWRYMHPSFNCLDNVYKLQKFFFLFIAKFQDIEFENIVIENAVAINYPFIQIQGYGLNEKRTFEKIQIKNSIFRNNIMIISSGQFTSSCISISSEQLSNITILNNTFLQNHLNSHDENQISIVSTTLTIDSKSSNVQIKNFLFQENLITNSKSSNLYLNVSSLAVISTNFLQNNLLNYSLLINKILFDEDTSQVRLLDLQSKFSILSEGGSGYIKAFQIQFEDLSVIESYAIKGGAFYIILHSSSSLLISNSIFQNNFASLLSSMTSQGGCLFIDAQNSGFVAKMKNITFNKTFSRERGGGVYIIPSNTQNQILFSQIKVQNCFSIIGAFFDFSLKTFQGVQSFLTFEDFQIYQQKVKYEKFLKKLENLQNSEASLLLNSHTIFQIAYTNITFSKFKFQSELGIYLANLEKCQFIKFFAIEVINSVIQNSPLLKMNFIPNYQGELLINNFQIKNLTELESNNIFKQCKNLFFNSSINFFCENPIINEASINIIDNSQEIFENQYICNQQYLQNTNKLNFSLIQITDIEKQNSIEIHQTDVIFLYKLIKIQSYSENNLLTDDNLSPFQLLYRFEGQKQYLQILTYSYTFPSVTLDFSQNPFLIKKEVLLTQEISLWHYLSVQFEENQLKVDLTFYDIDDNHNLNFLIEVNHFHYIKFQIQFGNLFQNSLNYINFRLLSFAFAPCQISILIQGCEQSCQFCNGPTKYDCLSCNPESKRIYLSESKSCVCPENMVDQDNNCISLENLIQPFTKFLNQGLSCQFGYFMYDDDTCVKCPLNPDLNTLPCLECLQNPYTWKSKAICKQSLLYNLSDSLYYQVSEDLDLIPIFIIDGTNVLLCQNCQQKNLSNIDDIYRNQLTIEDIKEDIIKYNKIYNQRACQQISQCMLCAFENDQFICKKCKKTFLLENNICLSHQTQIYCNTPYYLNSRKQCQLCKIEYCIYCFEYLENDSSKSTLYKQFEAFEINEFHQIGCALCKEGFQFNFLLSKCIFQEPNIQNCIRSFIKFDGNEVCTLSNLSTFGLSPEIQNCQKKIPNCQQCLKTPSQIIKCIVCDDGYSASILTGKCSICPHENSKICIQGDLKQMDAWVQLIQSFIMQFLNKNYFYPKGAESFIFDFALTCQDGYMPNSIGNCFPFCKSDCLRCAEIQKVNKIFQCLECPKNQFNKIQRSTDNINCLKCPKLCSICQIRSTEEINSLNHDFIVTDENVQFTYKCLQSVQKDNTTIDSKLQIAKQIFGNETQILNFDFEQYCDILSSQENYESYINLDYCNQQGIENIQITVKFINEEKNNCEFTFDNSLKQKVFSLNFIFFILRGKDKVQIDNNIYSNSITVSNFDQIKFEFMHFFLVSEINFLFSYQNLLILQFENVIFSSDLKPIKLQIQSTQLKYIDFTNLTFLKVNFSNTIVFNISGEYMQNQIYLNNIKIQDCYFLDSILISIFSITSKIVIQNLIIENCIFINSTIVFIDADSSNNIIGQFNQLEIRNNKFFNTNCFLNLRISYIQQCYFSQSNLFSVMVFIIDLSQFNVFNNLFYTSSILKSTNEQMVVEVKYEITNLNVNNNLISDCYLFQITPKYNQQDQDVQIYLKNLNFEKNNAQDIQMQSFLFYIHCNTIQVENIKIIDQFNINFLYIFETKNIEMQQLVQENSFQNKMIPLGYHCQSSFNSLQVLKVYGFVNLKLKNIKITSLNTQDSAFIELLSNIFWNSQEIEQIYIQNINFSENILLKQTLGARLSQILIFSENIQNIIFREINFSNNLLHQTVDDSSDTVAGLIYIKSSQRNLEIFDFVSNSNWLTNSSSSFFYAEGDFLSINNQKCENLNVFNQQFLENYLSIPINFLQTNQEEIQFMVEKILTIQTKGCACFALVRKLQIINGQFKKIISKTSPLFEIQTQSLGQIILQDIFITQIDVIYESNIDVQGCIYIYSSSSNLDLKLFNIEFVEVFNKFSPSIITIIPSQRKNNLIFQNILFKNSISLKNQILKIEFSQKNVDQNVIKFQNISIIQTEQAWIKYFQKIGQISQVDLEKIMNDNGLINLVYCQLSFQQVIIEGVFISPIIRILDSVDLKIVNCKFIKIQTFYQFNLIQIEQNKQYSIRIYIFNNLFWNIKLFQPSINNNIENLIINSEKIYYQCFFNLDNFIFNKINFTLNSIIILFQAQQNQNQGALLYIQSLSNQTKIFLSQLNLIENNCNFCNKGLVYIDIVQILKLDISQLICLKNQIIAYGCLNIKSSQLYKNYFQLKNSKFGFNLGQSGAGIFFSGLKGMIKNCIIFNNSAIFKAGGIAIDSKDNDFVVKNTLIFQNSGYKGGGLIIDNTSNINTTNFIQSFLEFNTANCLVNNLIEAPTQLNLQINGQKMRSYQQNYNNITENYLKLENYKLYQQDSLIGTKYLFIPSNQKITDYNIYDQKSQVFKKYIYDLDLYFSNSYQETLGDSDNQNCSIFQNIILMNGSLIHQSEKFLLYFNTESNKIELGDLYFTFDPYEQSNLIQQIEIFCKISDIRALSYKINTKTFFCQLGEFYSQGGCQICEYNYGFYSVTYNATKCSIFDKTKFKAITSNTIQLIPGFWRPNYLSDFPEQCFKDTKFCLGEWKVGDQSCLYGHIGGLCEECDFYNVRGDGYYFKNPDNTGCLLCDENKSYIILFIFASFLAIFSILITLNIIATTNKLFASLKTIEKFGKIIFKLNQDHSSFLLKMFFNYLWIFSIIFTYNISFSINLNVVDQASNTSYFMANNLDCFLSSIQDANLIYIRIIGTIVFIFIQILLIYLLFLILSKFKKSKFDYSNISNTCLYLYISNNASITKQFCSLIAKRVISNISYVQGNVSLQFYSQNHQSWFYYFVLPGLSINGCIIPLLLIAILYTKRNSLDQIKVRRHICYLFNEYNDQSYFWEQIKIWQKTLIILIMTYFQDDILLKTTLLGLSLMLYQFLATKQKPYIIQNLNKLDIETGQICIIAIFLAAVGSGSTSSNQALKVIQIIIIMLCLLLIYFYFSVILKAYAQKYKIIILNYIWIFFKAISSQSTLSKYFENLHSQEKFKKDRLQKNYAKLRLHFSVLSKTSKINQRTQRLQSIKQIKNFVSEENDLVISNLKI